MTIIIRRPWTRQPTYAAGVANGNPLSAGLVFVHTPTSGPFDVVSKLKQSPLGSGVSTQARSRGLAYVATGAASASDGSWSTWDALSGANTYTSLAVVKVTGGSGSQHTIGKWDSASPQFLIQPNITTGKVVIALKGNAFQAYETLSSGLVSLGNVYVLAHTYNASRGDYSVGHRLYINGALYGGGFNTVYHDGPVATPLTSRSSPLTLFSDGDGNTDLVGEWYFGAVWNRELNESQIAMVSANPWQLFAQRRIIIPTSTAAATAPTLSALSAINVTATSAQPRITYTF